MSDQNIQSLRLLRILFRGRVIDVQPRSDGVIDLTVRADKQDGGTWWRLRQHIANAVLRAGDFLHPCDDYGRIRVVERVVPTEALDDGLTNRTDTHLFNRLPVHLPNGDASYEALFAYEGVEHKELHLLGAGRAHFGEQDSNAFSGCRHWLDERAGGAHVLPDEDTGDLEDAELLRWLKHNADIGWDITYDRVIVSFELEADSFDDLRDAIRLAQKKRFEQGASHEA